MFSESINEITFEKVENFCKESLPEGIRLDYKQDFPRDLAKTISAFANTYGGLILIGVEETDRGTPNLPIKGIPLERGLEERISAIALRGIYPPVFPEIKVCEFASEGSDSLNRAVVAIRVQESPDAPHAIENKTKVYIRVERQNEPYELADVDQILALKGRRERAIENRQRMITNAWQRCQNVLGFDLGVKPTRAITISPVFPHEPLVSLDELYMIAQQERIGHEISPGRLTTMQEGVMFKLYHPAEDDFNYMELTQQGLILYLENCSESQREEYKNSLHIGRTIVVIGRSLEYALRCYEKMGFWGNVRIELLLTNVLGSRLTDDRSVMLDDGYACPDEQVRIEATKSVSELRENHSALVEDFMKTFTWAFGCQINPDVVKARVERVLTRM